MWMLRMANMSSLICYHPSFLILACSIIYIRPVLRSLHPSPLWLNSLLWLEKGMLWKDGVSRKGKEQFGSLAGSRNRIRGPRKGQKSRKK